MLKLKTAVSLIFTVPLICIYMCPAFALDIDIRDWNSNTNLYPVVTEDNHSNSSVELAFLKVKYDHPSNRVKLLFLLEFATFTSEENVGVTLSVNDSEKITLHLDGTSEYNEDKYFAEIKYASDARTKSIYMELTLGIKEGLPEKMMLRFNFYDTEGIPSNTFIADISERVEPSSETSAEEDDVTEKTSKTKTTKIKTTKTTKTKADKKKTTTSKNAAAVSTTLAEKTIIADKSVNKETSVNENNIIGIIAVVAVAAVGIGTCAVNIFKHSKK